MKTKTKYLLHSPHTINIKPIGGANFIPSHIGLIGSLEDIVVPDKIVSRH